jgi:hypothetical protein
MRVLGLRVAASVLAAVLISLASVRLHAQERGADILERLVAAYESFDFSRTRELSLLLLQPEVVATPAERAQATFFAAATSLLATPPDRGEARRLLTRGIRLDVFSAPDTSRFSADVLLEYERARRAVFAIGVHPLPADTSLTLDSADVEAVVGATRASTVRVSLESARRTSYELASGVRVFGQGRARLNFARGTEFVPTGAYTLRFEATDDSAGARTLLTLPVDVTSDTLPVLPLPTPIPDSAFRRERQPSGPGVQSLFLGLLVGGLTAAAPILATPPSLRALLGDDVRAVAVGAGMAFTGLVTLIAQRPGRAIPDAVAYNTRLRADWESERQRVVTENARHRAAIRIRLQFGEPSQ